MNWEAIGAIGEVVGAAAVVLTLIYLSSQLRQNTEAVKHAADRGVYEDAREWMYRIVEDPEIADLYRSGIKGEELTPTDRLRFRLLIGALFNHWQHAFESGAFRIVDNSNIQGVLSQPGGMAYWQDALKDGTTYMDPGFVEHINSIRDAIEKVDQSVDRDA